MDDRILNLLGQSDYRPSNVPELLKLLELNASQQQRLQAVLKRLQKDGVIIRTKGNRYIQSRTADLLPGVIQITRQGKGFFQPSEEGVPEISIPERATLTALNGDKVLVRRDVAPNNPRKAQPEVPTGIVVRILERKQTRLVGTLQRTRQFLYVAPDDSRIPSIYVPPPRDVGKAYHIGDKVVVELQPWDSPETNPEGEVIEILGAPDEEGVDMLSVVRNYDLPLHFPKNVLQEANAIAKSRVGNEPAEEEIQDRVDCRDHLVVTIDPDDAKDFDDAICLQKTTHDRWKLWVHIADVSYYVTKGSALDTEAKKRGNSTYLVDRVIPMLPEALSNELCSLKPEIDRLTKCVEFLLSSDGSVLETKFYSAVIRSKRRFTYKEALQTLQKAPKNAIENMLHDAHVMAQNIRSRRFKNGSLDLDFPDNKIRLDEQGKVLRIELIENDVSHQLIEEYMLLANEAVATRLMDLRKVAVYRIHEAPKAKRLQDFRDQVQSHKIACGDLNQRPNVQRLLNRLKDLAIGPALKIGFLKSLMRARYSAEPLGHYGLSKDKYTHFTSPIRRYADLVVHRVLFEKSLLSVPAAKEIADHITATERNSSDAERDSKEVKMYAFLMDQIKTGKFHQYPAFVTDLRNFGFFIDVPALGMGGLIPLSSIQDDFFMLDTSKNQLVGRRNNRIIKLGDQLMVQVFRIDTFKKQVDFKLVDKATFKPESENKKRKSTKKSATKPQKKKSHRKP